MSEIAELDYNICNGCKQGDLGPCDHVFEEHHVIDKHTGEALTCWKVMFSVN